MVTSPVLGGPVTAEKKLGTLGLEAKGGSNSVMQLWWVQTRVTQKFTLPVDSLTGHQRMKGFALPPPPIDATSKSLQESQGQ